MKPQIAVACIACLLLAPLVACAPVLVAGVPLIVYTEVLPRAVNGKGLAEDGVDLVTGKDCRLIEGTLREDRRLCETRGSEATRHDFKGLYGMYDDGTPTAAR